MRGSFEREESGKACSHMRSKRGGAQGERNVKETGGEERRGGGAGWEGEVVVGIAGEHAELECVGACALEHEQRLHCNVDRGVRGLGL
jgi:hypothetical protein